MRISVLFVFCFFSRNLSWRDIQHIIARTARPDLVRISRSAWNINKAGLRGGSESGFLNINPFRVFLFLVR